jgi:hypothetical protein
VSVSIGALFWGTWEDVPFITPLREEENIFSRKNLYEDLEIYVKEGSGKGQLSPKGPQLGNLEGFLFPGTFER